MSACQQCPSKASCASANQGSCPSSRPQTKSYAPLAQGSHIRFVLAVGSGKGGVGKSTLAATLAVRLKRQGLRVGVLDADITGPSMGEAFGIGPVTEANEAQHIIPPRSPILGIPVISLNSFLDEKTDPVVWRGPVITRMLQQFWSEVAWGALDVLVIDMPPGTGDVPLTLFQTLPIDRYLLVTTPQSLVRMVVGKTAKMANKLDIPFLGLVENMTAYVCPDCGHRLHPFGEGRSQAAAEALGVPFLESMPIQPELTRAMDEGRIDAIDAPYLPVTVAHIEALVAQSPQA